MESSAARSPLILLLERILLRLVEPHPAVPAAGRRSVRLLSGILLVVALAELGTAVGFAATYGSFFEKGLAETVAGAATLGAYLLSRTRRHATGALLGIAVLCTLPFAGFLSQGAKPEPWQIVGTFVWMVVPVTAACLFYSMRAALVVLGLVVGAYLAMARLLLGLAWSDPAAWLPAVVVLGLALNNVLTLWLRRKVEDDRLAEVERSHADLAAVRVENDRLAREAQEIVRQLGASVAEILAATRQQAEGAATQSAAITQTTAAMSELDRLAQGSAATSARVAQNLQRAQIISNEGRRAVEDTTEAIARLRGDVGGIAEQIQALAEHTRRVGEITRTVEDFASQSNILALNASIEAAAAGQAGAGFAVVAREIRSLAERSRQATEQIASILGEILRSARTSAEVTERGVRNADERVKLTGEVRQSIADLGEVIRASTDEAATVADQGGVQAAGIDQIAQSMQEVLRITTSNLAATGQVERAAQGLEALARALQRTVEQYRA